MRNELSFWAIRRNARTFWITVVVVLLSAAALTDFIYPMLVPSRLEPGAPFWLAVVIAGVMFYLILHWYCQNRCLRIF